jgi:hypothetical protein
LSFQHPASARFLAEQVWILSLLLLFAALTAWFVSDIGDRDCQYSAAGGEKGSYI